MEGELGVGQARPGWRARRDDRVIAAPGSRDYGYLTVITQSWANVGHVVHVPPGAFRPPPKVDSSVIRLTPKPDVPADLAEFLRPWCSTDELGPAADQITVFGVGSSTEDAIDTVADARRLLA